MDESHCMGPDIYTPEFSPKQIIALYLKFKPDAFCYLCWYYPWITFFHIWPPKSNEPYNS